MLLEVGAGEGSGVHYCFRCKVVGHGLHIAVVDTGTGRRIGWFLGDVVAVDPYRVIVAYGSSCYRYSGIDGMIGI